MSFDPANIKKWPEYVQDLYYEGYDLIQYIDKVKNYNSDIDEAMELETDIKRWLHKINMKIISKTLYKSENLQIVFDEIDKGIFTNDSKLDQVMEYALRIIESVPFYEKIQEKSNTNSVILQINILKKEGITDKQIAELADKIKHSEDLIDSLKKLQSEKIGEIRNALKILNPYFRKAFNKKFDTNGTKILKVLSKIILGHFVSDFGGDQIDLSI